MADSDYQKRHVVLTGWPGEAPQDRFTALEVVTSRQEIADRHEIEQYDREPERRKIGRTAATPADATRGEQLERIHGPAQERDEDLGILERHVLNTQVPGRVQARLPRPYRADDHSDREEHPAED